MKNRRGVISKEADIGKLGENIAEKYLRQKGYRILDKNYVNRFARGQQRGEIDIIAGKKKSIIFVEVKTLARLFSPKTSFFRPENRVDFKKKRRLIMAAQTWLMQKKLPLDTEWRVDIIGVYIDQENRKAQIRHFRNTLVL